MDLNELRTHLDRLDNALLYILAERMSLIPKVAQYKKENNIARHQPEREAFIISHKREEAIKLLLNPDLVESIYKTIIADAHRIEKDVMGE